MGFYLPIIIWFSKSDKYTHDVIIPCIWIWFQYSVSIIKDKSILND